MKRLMLSILCLASPLMAGDNLLKNAGFENEDTSKPGQPVDWGVFTETGVAGPSASTRDAVHDGAIAFKLAFEGKTDRFLGVSQNVPVQAGQKFKLAAYVRNGSLQGNTFGQVGLEWKDGTGQELSRDLGEKMTIKNLSASDWTRFELIATAPAKAASVTATITLVPEGSTDGSILVDDVRLEIIQ